MSTLDSKRYTLNLKFVIRSPNALAGVRGEVEKGESPGPTLKTEDSKVLTKDSTHQTLN